MDLNAIPDSFSIMASQCPKTTWTKLYFLRNSDHQDPLRIRRGRSDRNLPSSNLESDYQHWEQIVRRAVVNFEAFDHSAVRGQPRNCLDRKSKVNPVREHWQWGTNLAEVRKDCWVSVAWVPDNSERGREAVNVKGSEYKLCELFDFEERVEINLPVLLDDGEENDKVLPKRDG
jgi:hypothetical protein